MQRNRLLLIAAGLAAVVVLFLVLRPGGDDDEAATTTTAATSTEAATTEETTTEETTTEETTSEAAPPPPEPPPPPPPPPAPEVTIMAITVRGGVPVGGVVRQTVQQDERVRIVVRADVEDEVHLHGYDIARNVAPGQPAQIAFTADVAGQFEIELEERGLPIGDLEVRP